MVYVNTNNSSESFTACPSKYPQKTFKDKPCRWCGTVFSPLAPSHLYCRDECSSEANSDKYLRREYNITLQDYQAMLDKQDGLCKICREPGFKMREQHKTLLVVDHCHTTGKIRGLLCHNCNRALGLLKDSVAVLKQAIRYLEGATTIP